MGANDISTLYTKKLLVKIKNDDNQERQAHFMITIEIHSISVIKKQLVVRLTEENDGFFLYTLLLSEDDFHSLKTQQGLLVDFHAFPRKFIDLLECCYEEETQKFPKFILRFIPAGRLHNIGEGVLEITEANTFKHLIHLSLKFHQGTDVDVKNYLLSCLKTLQVAKVSLENKLTDTETTLNCRIVEVQETLASRSAEFHRLQMEWKEEKAEMNNRFSQEFSREKERTSQFQSELQTRFEREKKDIEYKYSKQIQALEDKLGYLETDNKALFEKRQQLESVNSSMNSHLSSLEEDMKSQHQEIKHLNSDNKALQNHIKEREIQVHSLKTQIAVLEQEVKNMESLKAHQQMVVDSSQEQKHRLEKLLEEKQQQLQKQENSNKFLSQEIKKANCIINNLQTELRKTLSKLKLRSQIAVEQEKLMKDKDQEMEALKEKLSTIKDHLQQKTKEMEILEADLEKQNEKVKDNERLTQEITWLQNQLTKKELTEHRMYTNIGGSPGDCPVSKVGDNQGRFGLPVATSTPQAFGYFTSRVPSVMAPTVNQQVPAGDSLNQKVPAGDAVNADSNGNKDKENEPPVSEEPLKNKYMYNHRKLLSSQQRKSTGTLDRGILKNNKIVSSAIGANTQRLIGGASVASAYFPVTDTKSNVR